MYRGLKGGGSGTTIVGRGPGALGTRLGGTRDTTFKYHSFAKCMFECTVL